MNTKLKSLLFLTVIIMLLFCLSVPALASDDATLSSLEFSDNCVLEPAFSPDITNYICTVYGRSMPPKPEEVMYEFTVITADSNAIIEVYKNNQLYDQSIGSYNWSAGLSLSQKGDAMRLVVTSPNGMDSKTYIINIGEEGSSILKLRTKKMLNLYLGSSTADVNDIPVNIGAAPFLYQYAGINYTMVPIRFIGEEGIGATVNWDAHTKTVSVVKGDTNIVMPLGLVNPNIGLTCPPIAVKNKVYVPIRYVSETLGCKVNYMGVNEPIIISINN